MRAIRKYKNGGGWPPGTPPPAGFDPQWMAEQLKFAQLLRDKSQEEQDRLDRLDTGTLEPSARYPRKDPFPSIVQTSASPELREERGRMNPLFQAAEYLTPVGDVMAGVEGLGQLISGDYAAGATNLGLAAASAFIPGPTPKVKPKVKVKVKPQRSMTVNRRPAEEVEIGQNVSEAVMLEPDGSRVQSYGGNKPAVIALKREHPFDDAQTPYYEPFIGGVNHRSGTAVSDSEFAKQVVRVMDGQPIDAFVGGTSLSTDSYPLLLSKYQKGQLSAGRYPNSFERWGIEGGDRGMYAPLNDMGRPYKNSDEVTAWHNKKAESDGMQQGPKDPDMMSEEDFFNESNDEVYDNRFTPDNQMSKSTFFKIDPAARKAVEEGNVSAADKLYDKYHVQSDNDFGVSSFGSEDSDAMLTQLEAQSLADHFNAKMRGLEDRRAGQVERAESRGKSVSPSEGIPPAQVNSHHSGGFYVEYPMLPFKRNFKKGGRIKVKKRRPPGMRLLK